MSAAYNLAILDLPNPTFLRIGGGQAGMVLTSTGNPNGSLVWGAGGGGGGGGTVVVDGTSIVGDGLGTALSVQAIDAGTFVPIPFGQNQMPWDKDD